MYLETGAPGGGARLILQPLHPRVQAPPITSPAISTLALGLGMNATVFRAFYDLAMKTLPGMNEAEALVQRFREWRRIEFGSNSLPHRDDPGDRSLEDLCGVAANWRNRPGYPPDSSCRTPDRDLLFLQLLLPDVRDGRRDLRDG